MKNKNTGGLSMKTETKQTQTPTPWSIERNQFNQAVIINDDLSERVVIMPGTQIQDEANAAFIVRSANNYELMLRALEYALERYPKLAGSLVEHAITEATK